jgi:zinc transport system substrate-binding protein
MRRRTDLAVSHFTQGRLSALAALLVLASLLSCTPTERSGPGSLRVAVSIAPQAFFVRQIAGDAVSIEVLLPPGQSPHTYDLSPQQMTRLSDADILFMIGMPFDQRLVDKFRDMLKRLRVVDTRIGVPMRSMSDHGHGGEAPGEIFDPHIWLNPEYAKIQATTIADSLACIDPSRSAFYAENLRVFARELDSVNALIAEILAPVRGKRIYVFHPAYGYFTDAYGLEQVSVEVDGKEPSVRQLAAMIESASQDTIRALFVQPQFPANAVRTLADHLGAKVVKLDPLAEDYLNNLVAMAREIRANLE